VRRVYLGLGSNLGDRAANLARAAQLLNSERLRVVRASSVYETAPRDFLHQPHFLNQVLEVDTDLLPLQLLARVKAVERRMGRRKTIDKGPRLIDVDILLYAGVVLETPQLTLPHAALSQRRFVLEPLAELAPELRHPVQGKTMRELLEGVRTQAVRRLAL
jgi:2-amino-4-hydroxy-6-hydroxymethyldihydropteridine diphosphokinase